MNRLSRPPITIDHQAIGAPVSRELTIGDLFVILRRRSRQIALITALCFLLGVAVCLFSTPKFEGKAVLEIPKTSADMLGLESLMAGPSGGPVDALNANLDLQTEAAILESDTLALKVIEELNLDKTRDFQPHFSFLGPILSLMSPSATAYQRAEDFLFTPEGRACPRNTPDKDQLPSLGS